MEPVAARDFVRFLLAGQRVTAEAAMEGPDAVAAVIGQLEGFEAAAGAWETEILPARIAQYEPAWLDDHCLAGRIAWARLRPRNGANGGERRASPVRTTPITLLARRHPPLWAALSPAEDAVPLSASAQAGVAALPQHGAAFFRRLVGSTGLLRAPA